MIIAQPKELIGAFVSARQGYPADTSWGNFNALGLVRHDRIVAGVIYNSYEEGNVCMHLGAEDGSRWATPAFLFAVFDYPFNGLRLRRATAMVRGKNERALRLVKNLGFTYEGTMRHYFRDDDAVIYGMLREECRFLDLRKAA